MRWEAAADGGSGGGCIVISEDAPLPGTSLGHMSFGGFSPALEAMQVHTNEPESLTGANSTELRVFVCLQSVRSWLLQYSCVILMRLHTGLQLGF